MKKINKKAELTSKQLITIIILIISFAIILIFFLTLGLRKTIDTETCRNSVILRGSLLLGGETVQLKCKTSDVCLSMGGDCGVTRKDLVTIKVKDENELTKEMVNLLWDCWWMMGEGKVDYMSAGVGFQETYCTICSRVNFDDKIKAKYKEQGGIPYSLIYNYMASTKVPERDETFLFSTYKVNSLDVIRGEIKENNNYDIYETKINTEKEYAVTTAMVKDGWGKSLAVGVATGAIAGVLAPLTFGGSIALGIAAGGGMVGISVATAGEDESYLAPQYLEFNGTALDALKCKEFVSEG